MSVELGSLSTGIGVVLKACASSFTDVMALLSETTSFTSRLVIGELPVARFLDSASLSLAHISPLLVTV